MSCCGKRRETLVHEKPAHTPQKTSAKAVLEVSGDDKPRKFKYIGKGYLAIKGLHSGKTYHFSQYGQITEVDYEDSFALMAENDLIFVRG